MDENRETKGEKCHKNKGEIVKKTHDGYPIISAAIRRASSRVRVRLGGHFGFVEQILTASVL